MMNHPFEYVLILSGDQLYRMDYRTILVHHVEKEADVTVATIPVRRREVPGLGIMQMGSDQRITRFVEKPKDASVQDQLRLDREWYGPLGIESSEDLFLASMGIYVFKREVLVELLNNTLADFGKHIIPGAIKTHRVFAYVFQGYWEDIGTIRAFFEANLELTSLLPRFNFFDMGSPIFTRPRFLPACKINGAQLEHALVAEGCILNNASIRHSLVGLRSVVAEGAQLHRTIMMGADYYESALSIAQHEAANRPRIGIGRHTRVENAIIDKNCRIGDNCAISPAGKPSDFDHPLYYIRDGVVVIPRNGCIPHGTTI
jgi:glucose-1-phosphate adenylyltransferase